jgi:hypothetical protein
VQSGLDALLAGPLTLRFVLKKPTPGLRHDSSELAVSGKPMGHMPVACLCLTISSTPLAQNQQCQRRLHQGTHEAFSPVLPADRSKGQPRSEYLDAAWKQCSSVAAQLT